MRMENNIKVKYLQEKIFKNATGFLTNKAAETLKKINGGKTAESYRMSSRP